MIVAAIGLLAVALVLLLVGIAKSSVAPLVLSVVATLGATGLLAASFSHYRRTAAAAGAADEVTPGYPRSYTSDSLAPVPPSRTNAPVAAPAVPPLWDAMSDDDAAALAATFGFDELQAVRAHEVANGYRQSVLAAIDERLDSIITTRRQIG